jgi:hypothetical protein
MKLTTAQIDQLYTFTRQHYVEWYDLQSELVDHLANAIETHWQENPKLTFDEALNNEFRKFGVFGFMGVVEEKQKFLGKKYRKLIWSYYTEFFRLPKIILTFLSMLLIYKLLIVFDGAKDIIFGLILILSLGFFVRTFYKEKFEKDKNTSNRKKWMFEDVSLQNRNNVFIVLPSLLINSFNLFFKESHFTIITAIIFSVSLVLLGLLIYIKIKIIPQKVSEELAKTYSEYSILNL